MSTKNWISPAKRGAIYDRDDHRCVYCGFKVRITDSREVPPPPPEQTATLDHLVPRNAHATVTADKAYSSKANVEHVAALGATPYIPFREGSGGGAGKLWGELFHFYQWRREEFLRHYHQRSNVETTFHMIKSKFGANVRSKDHVAQVNEAYLKVLCHNIVVVHQSIEELGIAGQFDLGAIGGAA